MNRYRALLIDSGQLNQERPVQIFAQDRSLIDEWTAIVLARAVSPDAVVLVYETAETRIAIVPKPRKAPGGSV
jgi:hypothetical protein